MYENIRQSYTTIVSYRRKNLPYDCCYTTCRSFYSYDIRYDTTQCERRVAGVYFYYTMFLRVISIRAVVDR
jgi:hypothetical protein